MPEMCACHKDSFRHSQANKVIFKTHISCSKCRAQCLRCASAVLVFSSLQIPCFIAKLLREAV